MSRNLRVQLLAGLLAIASLAGAGSLLPGILRESEEHALRYTDVAVENAPPIVALGTAIGALRGIIVDVLWIRVQYMKEKGLFFDAQNDAELITKLQPRFAPVWSFHGHNMAYNISVATHTQQERWQWVKKGIDLVRNSGLRYNPTDIELYKELAFWFNHKIEGISDDAHLYYKTQFAREWHRLLGAPPAGWDERTAWMKRLADAPNTLDEAERRTPGVIELVEKLRANLSPFDAVVRFELNKDFLFAYEEWREITGESRFAEGLRMEDRLRRQAASGDDPVANMFVALDELAADPQYREQWKTLIPFLRKKVLREDYNMDAQLMYEFTRDVGPVDWRHPSAHALYWARVGSLVAETRSKTDQDEYKILNNDRMQIQAMQELTRSGSIAYDPFSSDLPSRLPDHRWIPVVDRFFEELYLKYQHLDGWGGDTFIAFHQNYLGAAVRMLYRQGHHDAAQEILERLDRLYGTGAKYPTTRYAVPLEIFVKNEVFQEYEMQPTVAVTDVQEALYYALRVGLGRGDEELYERVKTFAAQVLEYFKTNEYNNFVNKFGEARIAGIIGDLEESEKVAFARLLTDQAVPLHERLRIWHAHADTKLRLQVYDLVLDTVVADIREHPIFGRPVQGEDGQPLNLVQRYFPPPPGIEQYRAALERQRQAEQAAEQERATIRAR